MTYAPPPATKALSRLRARLPRTRNGRRWLAAAVTLTLLVLLAWLGGGGGRRTWPRDQVLAAIRFVESGNRDDVPDGDGGKAIGPYQIHHVYWQDALRSDPSIGGDYQDCRKRDYAERVIAAYMQHWVPGAWRVGDAEVIARVHNGGPGGDTKTATDRYWERVRARLP